MRHRFPSLRALNAFESVGRLGSVSHAAKELMVTPGAVSRQVSLLEAHLGCVLFVRRGRGMELTGKGLYLFRATNDAFTRLDEASTHLMTPSKVRLSLKAYPTFSTEWLVPRLASFYSANPWIDFRLTTSLEPLDFRRDDIDAGVDQGSTDIDGVESVPLFHPVFFPVCSPALLDRGPPLNDPNDLRKHTLIYTLIQKPMWLEWLAHSDVQGIDPERGLLFENSSLAYRAAREGLGVVLGQRFFIGDDLASRRLVAPFKLELSAEKPYRLLFPSRKASEAPILIFRKWLLEQIAQVLAD